MSIYKISNRSVSEWVIHAMPELALEWWRKWQIEECGISEEELNGFEVVEEISGDQEFTLHVEECENPITLSARQWCALSETLGRSQGRFLASTEY